MPLSARPPLPLDDFNEPESSYTALANVIPTKFSTCVFPPREKKHQFLPEGCVKQLISKEVINHELPDSGSSCSDEDLHQLREIIYTQSKKLFAISLTSGFKKDELLWVMRFFRHYDITDESLPILQLDQQNSVPGHFGQSKFWTLTRRIAFYDAQWKFLAPVFSNDKFIYELESDHILPFTWVDDTVREGSFSKVFQVEIHPSHQQGLGLGNFAIKEIDETKEEAEKNWDAEAKALDEITGLKHDHIIQRIAAVTKGGKKYFMFAWADGGSLRDHWQRIPRPSITPQLLTETLEQLLGLFDALRALHNFNGVGAYRHGDLKPENVLVFNDNSPQIIGTLKIADMGLAKYHGIGTVFRKNPTSTKAGTMRYEPPETKTTIAPTSRLYDVWSMGCIVFEHLVWLLYGYEHIEALNAAVQQDEGYYFKIVEEEGLKTAMVHPEVEKCLKQMAEVPQCKSKTALKDLLELVTTKLLVVALNPKRTKTTLEDSAGDNAENFIIDVTKERDRYGDEDENDDEENDSFGALGHSIKITKTTEPAVVKSSGQRLYRADTDLVCKSLDAMILKAKQEENYLPPRSSKSPPLPQYLSQNTAALNVYDSSPARGERYAGGLGGGGLLTLPQRQDVSTHHAVKLRLGPTLLLLHTDKN
jgi:serine/threonine protein kinase